MDQKLIELISNTLGITFSSVKSTLQLMEDGATIPFIARYRKEMTGSLDEVQISDIQKQYKKLLELVDRKVFILSSIEEQGKLTPELAAKITASFDPNEIEDLYLPYKRKKKTKAAYSFFTSSTNKSRPVKTWSILPSTTTLLSVNEFNYENFGRGLHV